MPDGREPPSWWVEYTFSNRGYRMEAYPPERSATGKVTVIAQDGRGFRLQLEGDRLLELELSAEEDSFLLEGFRYRRTGR